MLLRSNLQTHCVEAAVDPVPGVRKQHQHQQQCSAPGQLVTGSHIRKKPITLLITHACSTLYCKRGRLFCLVGSVWSLLHVFTSVSHCPQLRMAFVCACVHVLVIFYAVSGEDIARLMDVVTSLVSCCYHLLTCFCPLLCMGFFYWINICCILYLIDCAHQSSR